MSWLRLYESVLDDPKVQQLPAGVFKGWINILCLAKRHDGILPPTSDIAFALRISRSAADALMGALEDADLIDSDSDGNSLPHNWNGRQYKSDVSNERVKRHRERKRNAECNVTVTPRARAESETDTDTETETEEKEVARAREAPPEDAAFDAYNRVADANRLPQCQSRDKRRRGAMRARLKEVGGLDGWTVALEKLAASSFLKGANDRGFVADIDFMLRPARLAPLMEGKYDDRKPTNGYDPSDLMEELGLGHASGNDQAHGDPTDGGELRTTTVVPWRG